MIGGSDGPEPGPARAKPGKPIHVPKAPVITALFSVVLAAGLLSACGGSATPPAGIDYSLAQAGERPQPPTLGPQADPNGHGTVHLNIVNGLLDGSPIYNGDFADPYALHVGLTVYVYASDTVNAHIPVIAAGPTDDFAGHYLGDALPVLPTWTYPGYQWAPSVWARPDGTYVMYYATPDSAPSTSCITDANRAHVSSGLCYLAWSTDSRQCISRAVANSPTGPFVDDSTGPFICPRRQGGAIDPSVFVAPDGHPFLVWKSDGNGYGLPTVIYSQRLSSDGLATAGPPHRLIGATQTWEGDLVEGPSMVEADGTFWLFYSANNWDTSHYAVGVARCASIQGPCTKPLRHSWLSTTDDPHHDQGPGGEEFLDIAGFVWMVHHGWLPGQAGTPAGQRRLYVDLLTLDGPHHLPALASGPLSAALADVIDDATTPGQPTDPQQAYLDEVHHSASSFAHRPGAALLALAENTCASLGDPGSAQKVVAAAIRTGADPLGKAVPVAFAVQQLCPRYLAGLRQQLQRELYH